MELRQLATFRTVATTLNFTRAASLLNYAQSSVTAQIQALEAEFGVPLFDRFGKRVALTDAGTRLLGYADRLLDLAEEARVNVSNSGEPSGTLVVGAPETICTYRLPPVLREFQRKYPSVRLVFQPLPYAVLHQQLREGIVDVAFLLEKPQESAPLCMERLIDEPLLVIAPPGHRLANYPSVRPIDLDGETLLLTSKGCGYRYLFEQALLDVGIHPDARLEFDSVEALKQCVMAGLGVGTLPAVAVEKELREGQLVALRWDMPDYQVSTQMVWHRDRWVSPALNAFLEMSRRLLTG
jgi:DNA-binding transcriptional LysR family regulator